MASTIRDVARKTGLSVGTISKYINGHQVKEANKKIIEEAIKDLNYKPNNIAKGLRNSQTFSVAVILPMLTSNFCTSMISSIEAYLLSKGYSVIVAECHNNIEMELKKTRFFLDRMVDGIVMIPYDLEGRQIDLIQENNIPLVIVDQIIKNHSTDTVILDNLSSSYEPIKKLISLNHKKIAIITGEPEHYTSKERLKGYKKALKEANIDINEEYIACGYYSTEGGHQAMKKLMRLENPPTAVFISNYDMEIGAYVAINNLNLKVPEDVSIIGFDNLPLTNILKPALSFVKQPVNEMGLDVAKILYKRMQGDTSDFPNISVHSPIFHYTDSIQQL